MAAANAEQLREMDAAVREVRRQYVRAKERVDANAGGWFASAEEKSIRKAFDDLAPLLEKWATVYYQWAAAGKRTDGTDYDVQRWMDFGRKDLADAVERISGEAYDRSLFAAVKHAAASVVTPSLWPSWVKPTLYVAGAVVGLVVIVNVARLVRAK